MSELRTRFRRMVVGLPQRIADQGSIEAAADLAELLDLELLATFVADETLLALAELPVARELRTLEQSWQTIDPAQITRDIERAESIARRQFAESIKSRTLKTGFDVLAGSEAIARLIRADDIVAIIEPTHPGERITRQFTGLFNAALEVAAATLAIPRRILRTTGPILALAGDSDDRGVRAGLEIAAALKERLIVATRPGAGLPDDLRSYAHELGVQLEYSFTGVSPAEALAQAHSQARSLERLRVITRSLLPDDASKLFSWLAGVPLLIVGPDWKEFATAAEEAAPKSSSA